MSRTLKLVEALQAGQTISYRPTGNSMTGKVNSGDKVTVIPMDRDPEVGDIVLAKVRGKHFLHLVSAVRGNQAQISNNHGHVNGWTDFKNVYGRVTKVEP